MPRGPSKEQLYYLEFLKCYGRPASVGQLVWAMADHPDSARLAATERKIGEHAATEDRNRWNSANRSLNSLVKRGLLIKVRARRGRSGVWFVYPFDDFRYRHHYKTEAIDFLAKYYLVEALEHKERHA